MLDNINQSLAEKIEEYGYAIIGVVGTTSKVLYTVGLSDILGYELIAKTTGTVETTHIVMNQFIEELKNGDASPADDIVYPARLASGELLRGRLDDVSGIQSVEDVVTVRSTQVNKIYQLVLADKNNVLPGEKDFDLKWDQDLVEGVKH